MNVVFLHGVSGGAAPFAPLCANLEAAGHRCLAWSAPGYDGAPMVAPYTLATLSTELQARVASLGLARPVLVGHSMGGMLALECAATWAEPPAALVLACTVPAFRLEGAARAAFLDRRLAGIDGPDGMAANARMLIPSLVGSDADPASVAAAVTVMSAIPAATYRLAVTALLDFDRRGDVGRINVPALCIAGEQDAVAAPAAMANLARGLPLGRYEEIPGAGHLVPLEQPRPFLGKVAQFLASLEETG